MKLPELINTKEVHINAVPDKDYPLRILRAYRECCNCKWEINSDSKTKILWETMNEHQDQRAKILDKAIAILEKEAQNVQIFKGL